MKIAITNIKQLVQADQQQSRIKAAGNQMAEVPVINDAYVLIEDGIITDLGKMADNPAIDHKSVVEIDASGRFVFPSFCDSHTHLVFPKTREIEYVDKIKGLSYEEIAKRGGGILNSAQSIREISENQLFEDSMKRADEIMELGTGAVEIKSGYGLDTEQELKILRVAKRLKEETPLTIKSTFLGAHAIPTKYKKDQSKYVDIVINEMLPAVAKENLADFVDVFCDKGFFNIESTDRILEAAAKYGLVPKIHANELDYSGGIQTGIKHNALSVDHLEYTGDEEIEALKSSETMPTVLPGAAFFLNLPYAPARKMIDAGLPVAMASDFNPGSSPSGNMQLILSMASILFKLTPREAINATTLNSAYAMDVSQNLGSISKGKTANLFITREMPGMEFMPYYYGSNKVDKTILNGELK
ncbi:MAG: imidazolonepropionase [Bacteroidales bacterium]|nr:imidazolonepropionase [Bacteroidales bacterium]MCF8336647.1 imidazolonepropionase [Bacteroidales bacterium]